MSAITRVTLILLSVYLDNPNNPYHPNNPNYRNNPASFQLWQASGSAPTASRVHVGESDCVGTFRRCEESDCVGRESDYVGRVILCGKRVRLCKESDCVKSQTV